MNSSTVEEVAEEIFAKGRQNSSQQSLLVGISGIDGSGKGYVAGQIVRCLEGSGEKAAAINIDGWLNLPHIRFNEQNPAEHFYNHAIRFDEVFSQLILPLKTNRSIDIIADFAEETAMKYRKHRYHYTDIDFIILEGIYLFKKWFRNYFDITVWIDSSFETALERAIQRAQEGLPPAETIRVYERIYFPAQQIHFQIDDPRANADFVIKNDNSLRLSKLQMK